MSIFDFIRKKEHRPETMNVTPEWISELKPNEIFVFGCRRSGRHYEGAANFAREYFGAIAGQGEGLQGQSYVIPTAGVGLCWIRHAVNRFTEFAALTLTRSFLSRPWDAVSVYGMSMTSHLCFAKHQSCQTYGCRWILERIIRLSHG